MTTAFVQIGGTAIWTLLAEANGGSLFLYSGLTLNFVASPAYTICESSGMQILSLVWGILSILGLGIAFVPCLGSLNWMNIPFAIVGLIMSFVAKSQVPAAAAARR